LFIEVNRIPPEGMEIDRSPELGAIGPGPEAIPVHSVRLTGWLRRSREDVTFRGSIEATVRLVCSRCTAPMALAVSGECYRIFRRGPLGAATAEREIDEDDLALTPFDGIHIDLSEMAREQIHLLVPLKPLCGETCAGLCPRCGANRNLEPCGCPEGSPGGDPLTLKLPL
jgi:DUF177 domain-containing protein